MINMKIELHVAMSEMRKEISRYVMSGGHKASLEETMVVEGDYPPEDVYRYHAYAKYGYRYELINRKPFNNKYTDEEGNVLNYEDLTKYGEYEELFKGEMELQY